MNPFPPGFPHYETEEQMWALIEEALNDKQEGIEMGSEEWKNFREELLRPRLSEKVAS